MRRAIFFMAGLALSFTACNKISADSNSEAEKIFLASFEADNPSFGSDVDSLGTKVTDAVSTDSTHTFSWEMTDKVTICAYRQPSAGGTGSPYYKKEKDSTRIAEFSVSSITSGKAQFSGKFTGWDSTMSSAYAIYPASGDYSYNLHSKNAVLIFKPINISHEQDGKNYLNYCHFIANGGTVTQNSGRLVINFPNKFKLTEVILKFKFSSGSYKKILITADNTTTTASNLTGNFNVVTSGYGINGTQGTGYWDLILNGDFNAGEDVYAVIRRLDPKSSGTKIKIKFDFYTNSEDTTPAKTKTFTQKKSEKIVTSTIYNLGTIPLD